MHTVHLIIKGKVQGVFFRATAKEKAEQYCIVGWVKNTRSGDVEVLATGEDENIQKFIGWCGQGPAQAKVTEVIVQEKATENFEKFSILR